jgi:Protein of unknown function (DUF2563)
MFVDTAKLHSGADESYRASEHAQAGANHLSSVAPASGMFGQFDAADDFHEAVSAAHHFHAMALRSHQESMNEVGARAHRTGYAFTEMDERNAKVLRALE